MNIVCLSHLRRDFVFQCPQHLLSRAARQGRVLYVEEPSPIDGPSRLDIREDRTGVLVAVPTLASGMSPDEGASVQHRLIAEAIRMHIPATYTLWYYTPMALE